MLVSIGYSEQNLLDYHRQISQALLGDRPSIGPPQIEVDGTGYVITMINIDSARGRVRIEIAGTSGRDVGTLNYTMPPNIPMDSYFFDEVPGASWGSSQVER